jgi:hypothetical protein
MADQAIGTIGKQGHFEPAAPFVKLVLALPRQRVSG